MGNFSKLKENTTAKATHFRHSGILDIRQDVYNDDDYPGGRHYIIPARNADEIERAYPSCTNVLNQIAEMRGEHGWLDAWREWVGAEEADRIVAEACRRGTYMHDMAENYLYNKDVFSSHINAWKLFKEIKPELDKINNIICLEAPLYSDLLGVAGRVDCVGEIDDDYVMGEPYETFDGVEYLIDFKSSRRLKKREDIGGYFRQITIYAMMLQETYGLTLDIGRIIMGVDNMDGKQTPGCVTFDIFIGDFRKSVIDEIAELREYQQVPFDKEAAYEFFL